MHTVKLKLAKTGKFHLEESKHNYTYYNEFCGSVLVFDAQQYAGWRAFQARRAGMMQEFNSIYA